MTKKAITFALAILLAGSLTMGCGKEKKTAEGTKERAAETSAQQAAVSAKERNYPQAPDFALVDLNGNMVKLSDYKGKMIILNFWATWCPPCRAEIPDFVTLYDEYKDKGLVIIGISLDRKGKAVVEEFAKKFKMNYPVVMGDMKVVSAYGGIEAIPTTFIVNPRGEVVNRFVGYRDKETFRKEIERWLLSSS